MDSLYKSKNVEIQGSGLRKIFSVCKKAKTEYEYVLNDFGLRFIFHRKNAAQHVTENVIVKLIDTDYEVLKALKFNPESTREVLAAKVGKTVRTIQRSLDRLTSVGKIIRIGSDKTGYWEVIE